MEEILIDNLTYLPRYRVRNVSFFHLSKEFWYCETCNKIKNSKEFRCLKCGKHKKELKLVEK
jgi:anaerobic ribonucleoside-triphosphate reductase